jgi:hypothetical protein
MSVADFKLDIASAIEFMSVISRFLSHKLTGREGFTIGKKEHINGITNPDVKIS